MMTATISPLLLLVSLLAIWPVSPCAAADGSTPTARGWTFRNQVAQGPAQNGALSVASTATVRDQLSAAVAGLRARGLQTPAPAALNAWMDTPFFRKLAGENFFKEGDKEFLLENGVLKAIRVTHGGKTYTLIPGEQDVYVMEPPAGTAGSQAQAPRVMRLKPDGTWELVDLDRVSDRNAVLARLRGLSGLDPALGRALAGLPGGSPTPVGGSSVPGALISPTQIQNLNIVNERTGTPTPEQIAAIPNGSGFWQGNDLYYKDAQGRVAKVGYQARMEPVPGSESHGAMIFWHGGAEPDAAGHHAQSRTHWALFFAPGRPAPGFEVEGGHTTARHIGLYHNFSLNGPGVRTETANGLTRLLLWTALRPFPTYESRDAGTPAQRVLFQYDSAPGNLRSYIGMDGTQYQDQQINGQTRIVRTGRIFDLRPAQRSAGGPTAPGRETDPLPGVQPSTGTAGAPVRTSTPTVTAPSGPPAPGAAAADRAGIEALLTRVNADAGLLRTPANLNAFLAFLRTPVGSDSTLHIRVAGALAENFKKLWSIRPGTAAIGTSIRGAFAGLLREPNRPVSDPVLQAVSRSYLAMSPPAADVRALLAGPASSGRLQLASALASDKTHRTTFRAQILPVLTHALAAPGASSPFGTDAEHARLVAACVLANPVRTSSSQMVSWGADLLAAVRAAPGDHRLLHHALYAVNKERAFYRLPANRAAGTAILDALIAAPAPAGGGNWGPVQARARALRGYLGGDAGSPDPGGNIPSWA